MAYTINRKKNITLDEMYLYLHEINALECRTLTTPFTVTSFQDGWGGGSMCFIELYTINLENFVVEIFSYSLLTTKLNIFLY